MTDENERKTPFLPFKSLAGALLFSVFLGPVGLLYASSLGGIVMIILGLLAFGLQIWRTFLLVWIGSCIWSVIAVNRFNNKIIQ